MEEILNVLLRKKINFNYITKYLELERLLSRK